MEKPGPPTRGGLRPPAGERAAGERRSLPELARLRVPENVGGSQTSAPPELQVHTLCPAAYPAHVWVMAQAQPMTLSAPKLSRAQHVCHQHSVCRPSPPCDHKPAHLPGVSSTEEW